MVKKLVRNCTDHLTSSLEQGFTVGFQWHIKPEKQSEELNHREALCWPTDDCRGSPCEEPSRTVNHFDYFICSGHYPYALINGCVPVRMKYGEDIAGPLCKLVNVSFCFRFLGSYGLDSQVWVLTDWILRFGFLGLVSLQRRLPSTWFSGPINREGSSTWELCD